MQRGPRRVIYFAGLRKAPNVSGNFKNSIVTKPTLLIFSTLFTLFSFGQVKQTVFTKRIVSTKTIRHKLIPGTNIFILPPAGFRLGDKESTLRFQDSIFISATTMIGFNYSKNSKTFTKEKFEKKGQSLIEFSEIRLNDLPAKIALYKIGSDNVYQIITGTSSFTSIILASFPSTNETLGKSIKKSLETIYCDKALKTDPFYSSSFRLDDSKSSFKLIRSNGSEYFYTKNGIVKETYIKDPFVLIRQISIYLGIDLKKQADEELKKRDINVDSINNEIKGFIKSNSAYERIVFGKQDGKKIVVFQNLIMLDEGIVLMQGFAFSEMDRNLAEFRKLTETIRQQ